MGLLDTFRSTRTALAEHDNAKTAEEARRVEAEQDPVAVEAAQLLGMKPSEIVSVDDTDVGHVIVTSDGSQMVLVPPDRPDAAGKVGLMFLVAPKHDMVTDFPIYAHDVTDEPPATEEPVAETTEAGETPKLLDEHSKAELVALADAAAVDVPPKATKADLVALLQEDS